MTVNTKTPKLDDFTSVARRLECDEGKAAFEAKLGKIAKAKQIPKRVNSPK